MMTSRVLREKLIRSPRYTWLVLGIVFILGALNYGDRGALATVFPLLKIDLDLPDLALAATGFFFLWSYAVTSPFTGYVGDRFSRSTTIIYSVMTWSVVMVLSGMVRNISQLLTTRVALGFGEAFFLPAAIALVSSYHLSQTRATAIAILTCGTYFGVIAVGTVSGYIGEHYGWRLSLIILGLFGIALALFCRLLTFDPPKEGEELNESKPAQVSPHLWMTIQTLLRIPSYNVLVLAAMLMSIGIWVFLNRLPLYFKGTF